jgi:hypothetical protein
MRMMMKVVLDTKAANKVIKEGHMPKLMAGVMERLKPEAAFFAPDESGHRCSYFVFDMKDPSMMPVAIEPLFQELDAHVHISPCMNAEDLQKGLAALAQHK